MSEDRVSADSPGASALPARVTRVLMTEESIYGLILVSGMIVVSNSLVGTSVNALITVGVTVIVFYAAHVYAGTIARLAHADGHGDVVLSVKHAARTSRGMLIAAIVPLTILLLGVTRVVDDDTAIWSALIADTVLLGVLGWLAVARWNQRFSARLASAVITAMFGVVVTLMKVLIHH